MPRVIESMTRIISHPFVIRVWRAEEAVQANYANDDLRVAVRTLREQSRPIGEVVEKLASMPRVNAVEALGPQGDGILIYPCWP